MALYHYSGFTHTGKKISGSVDAPSLATARQILLGQRIYITTISTTPTHSLSWLQWLLSKNPTIKDKIFFTKQLGVLLKAGIPLLSALELLAEQTEEPLRSIVISLKDSIKEGTSFADALARYPRTFDNVYVQLVKAGEASGKLETILERLTTFLERQQEIKDKIRSALSYPLIQLGMIGVVVLILLTFVVPSLAKTFERQGADLPLPTKIIMVLSTLFTSYWWILVIIIAILAILFYLWKSSAQGARALDRIKLSLPIISYFSKMGAVVQFTRTLGILIEGGVNFAESLTIVSHIINNSILIETLEKARDEIVKQGKISQYLAKTGIFPPIALYLINTGEQSGQLDTMLLTVASYYERELADHIDGLTEKINPAMLIIMAITVGFIVLSIALPLMQIGNSLPL